MNSYKEITNKYLKHNKKRTMLTILGVILSVALITAVGLFIESLQNSFVESAINQNGSYHVKIQKITADDYSQLKANPKIEKVGIQEKWFESNLKDGKKIEINKYNKSALEFLPKSYNAVKGRLPEKEGEIAIENWAFSYMKGDLKIGDTIKFEADQGEEKKFKITGIIQNQAETQYNGTALGMTYSTIFNIEKSAVYVSIYKKAGISNTVSELSNKFKDNCILNKDLLDYSGEGSNNLNKQLYGIAGVIIGIIVIATIAVIYNSFQISVIERMKQFGLLRAVGATPAQIRKIVLREASIISAMGIPLGLLSGIFAMFVVSKIFSIMSDTAFNNLKIVIPYYVLVISALVGVISIYLSAFIPARAASKVSPLVAISSRTSISKEKISKKRGNILKRFLNIESLMAFKNIKRNKKKFRVTVFSMVISIALFIFFSSFINMMTIFTGSQSEDVKMNFELIGVVDKKGTSSLKENIINKVKQSKLVDKQYVSYGTYSSNMLIPNEKRNDYLVKNAPKVYSDVTFENKKMSSITTLFDIYDDDKIRSIKSYIKSGKVDTSNMAEENGVVIVKNSMLTVNKKYYSGSITNLKVGDTIYIDKNMMYRPVQGEDYIDKNKKENEEFNKDNMIKVKVAAVVDDAPYQFYSDNLKLFHIIMTKDVMKNITGRDLNKMPVKISEIRLKDKKDEDKFNSFIEPICDKEGVKAVDISKQSEVARGNTMQLMILMYGFIVVISLIGAVNIINTITTNLILRKKEIASLSAIGMTYKNIRQMILKEGVLYGLYGALYGGIVGSLLSYSVSSPMRKIIDFKWNIPWNLILVSGLAAIFIGLISVIKPLARIKRENIIDVIRQED
ncbi:ABC transporter permease [Clostridium autoethanogenum]|uniref:FtsX-like permease family protein n=1 Tax=Clostridium autoethanogenum DSM 10061 TaxID=1341692 RepID=A0ABN4BHG0_9CLOT|nr:FtsX-like permease family protein [Clostridium autoethanogenum]AGY77069.1 FtsX-like permease family protein [Clostridium autoethanogenum DSM 10061]ALU37210.1 MacB-like periplasmic core domain-containing protein [Clostridium autoethanogenum DSM 10061]OVY50222.1 ABC transporter permease YtrF precursor [Clostridium autoethanogenum]